MRQSGGASFQRMERVGKSEEIRDLLSGECGGI